MSRILIALIALLIPLLNIVSPVIGAGVRELGNSNPNAMPPTPSGAQYVVRPGDTLIEIARRSGTDLETLVALNGIENPRLIREGQVLLLPGGAAKPAQNTDSDEAPADAPNGSTRLYVVQPGDTLFEIARANGTDIATLIELNQLNDPGLLVVGDVLLLPDSAASPNAGLDEMPIPTETPLPVVPVANIASAATEEVDAPPVATPEADTAVVIALDTSETMAGASLASMKNVLRQFIRELSASTEVGLVTFGGKPEVLQAPTTESRQLTTAINNIEAGGQTALYEGSLEAVKLLAESDSDHRYVVVVSDGVEAGVDIAADDAGDVLALAQEANISIIVVGLGLGDQTHLEVLAEGTGAPVYQTPDVNGLGGIFRSVATAIETARSSESAGSREIPLVVPPMTSVEAASSLVNELEQSLESLPLDSEDTPVGQLFVPGSWRELLNLPIPGDNRPLQAGNTETVIIPPLDDGVSELDFTVVDEPLLEEEEVVAAPATVAAEAPAPVAESLMSNLVPINIHVPEDADIEVAELAINGYRLQTFNSGPYSYELDTNMLTEGMYKLTFTVSNTSGVVSAGSLDFEVILQTLAEDGPSTLAKSGRESRENVSGANRVLLIDGQESPFELAFSMTDGLRLIQPEEPVVTPAESVLDILRRPIHNLIPEPVWQSLTTPRPREASIVVLLMTLSLLPQGIFTLYWMMYSWNNPRAAEQDQAPREFAEPQLSFTALLPARHEEDVIKDTIMAVDRLDYPEELKEVLVLIRDDDEGTIAKAQEAIDELGKPNIRLVTFNTGPINKPHSLNIGLREATKDVVCVFDAEDEPHPELYNVINTVMLRDNADVVQSGVQLMNFRSTWFSALNVLEYFFWFKSGLKCFTRQFHVTPLGGNTVFFKKHWLEAIGGWDEACLTEDADVGIRLTLAGAKIQIVYDAEYATQEETPANVESFIKQRTRWCQGFYQVFFKGDWAKLPMFTQKMTAIYILLNSLMQAAIVLFLPLGAYIALTQRVPVPIALLSYFPIYLLLLQMITNLIGIREFTEAYGLHLPFLFRLRMAIVYYPYQLMMTVAAARAVYRLVSQNHAWEKTAHSNLHRQGQIVQGRA